MGYGTTELIKVIYSGNVFFRSLVAAGIVFGFSACNTDAPEKDKGSALSGLARAFLAVVRHAKSVAPHDLTNEQLRQFFVETARSSYLLTRTFMP